MENIYDVDNMSDEEAQAKAHSLGWRPREEFSGDPEKFTDAKTFLAKANENIPMLRENYRKVEAQNQKLQEKIDALSNQMAQTAKRFEDAERRGYERAVKDIENQQRAAVVSGDVETWDKLQKQKQELSSYSYQEPERQPNKAGEMSVDDKIALEVFQATNPWFRNDVDLNEDMSSFVLGIKTRNPNMPMAEVLEKAKAKVVKANPDKFNDGKKTNDVLPTSGNVTGQKSYNTLSNKAVYDNEWNYMEREMRVKGKSDADIEKAKKAYQANCLSN